LQYSKIGMQIIIYLLIATVQAVSSSVVYTSG